VLKILDSEEILPVSGLLATPKTDNIGLYHTYLSMHGTGWEMFLCCRFAIYSDDFVLCGSIFTKITLVHRPVVDCCAANPQQVYNKSATNPQQVVQLAGCCGFVVNKSTLWICCTTNPCSGVWVLLS